MSEWINKAKEQVQQRKRKEKLAVFGIIGGIVLAMIVIVVLLRRPTSLPKDNTQIILASNSQVKEIANLQQQWICLAGSEELKNHPKLNEIKFFIGVLKGHGKTFDTKAYNELMESSDDLRNKLDINSDIWDFCKKKR